MQMQVQVSYVCITTGLSSISIYLNKLLRATLQKLDKNTYVLNIEVLTTLSHELRILLVGILCMVYELGAEPELTSIGDNNNFPTGFEKRPTVLLVEDDRIVQKVHRSMLERLGYLVDIADTGEQALIMFPRGYDIIIMDIGLPDISGLKVIEAIRVDRIAKHTPIIAITAYVQTDIKNDCLKAGADAVAIKPINADELKELMHSIHIKGIN